MTSREKKHEVDGEYFSGLASEVVGVKQMLNESGGFHGHGEAAGVLGLLFILLVMPASDQCCTDEYFFSGKTTVSTKGVGVGDLMGEGNSR